MFVDITRHTSQVAASHAELNTVHSGNTKADPFKDELSNTNTTTAELKDQIDKLERMYLRAVRDKERSVQEKLQLRRQLEHSMSLQDQQQVDIARLSLLAKLGIV